MNLFDLGRGAGSSGLLGEEAKKVVAWNNVAAPGAFVAIDCDGRTIRLRDYGNRLSEFGWEVDHITPKALGGTDAPNNLRARHWRGNSSAGGILGGLMNLGRNL